MLPLIAVLAVALLSMAALTIDLGFAAAQQNRLEVAAESAARGAVREELRLRHDVLLGRSTAQDLACTAEVDASCLAEHASARGRALSDEILGQHQASQTEETEVDLRPGSPDLRLARCGPGCWEASLVQAIPLLFGQSSMLGFEAGGLREIIEAREDGAVLAGDREPMVGDLRNRGVPIGFVARVDVEPVVRVGRQSAEFDLPGRAPFALSAEAWRQHWSPGSSRVLTLDGIVLSMPAPIGEVGQRLLGATTGERAGTELVRDGTPEPFPRLEPHLAYVPLTVGAVVVGFGFARVQTIDETQIVVERLEDRVAPGNASASPRFLAGAPRLGSLFASRAGYSDVLLAAPVSR